VSRPPFEKWRKIMIGAALVILGTAIARALWQDMPELLYAFGYAVGIVGLGWGYGTFFRSKP
jgi:hypothetical protein